ncbi:MAG: ISAs1 family transposase, partial [Lewinellaceae bacterium]|nr:ISAs1 family transposase [Lewinellaceae bacterium]
MESLNHFEKLKIAYSGLKDPRLDRTKLYPLMEIVFLTVSAVISGCQAWDEIADFGEAKLAWLRQYLPFENGTPSHDTINRVISLIDYRSFEECFISWTKMLLPLAQGSLISIDGKTLRGSVDSYHNKAPIHLVNAWCNDVELALGQYRTEAKSNEITAIPQLLDLLSIEGCIITIDAMGCQKNIAEKIIDSKGDYILALKTNQSELFEEASSLFKFLPV